MNPVLLLDLDNTLLQNNIDEFLPRYLKAFSDQIANTIAPERFVQSLKAGTQAMTQNQQPDCTLQEVFESVFYPLTGVDPIAFQVETDLFYKNVFPSLRSHTKPIPQAGEFVKEAHKRSFDLVVTTNPLFPHQAISQRLAWANLPFAEDHFRLITSYETFHFAKPNPAFLAEVMGMLGWPGELVIVVGDDFKRDILPARLLGLPAYWVNGNKTELDDLVDQSIGGGSIDQFMDWMDRSPADALVAEHSASPSWLATLRATPAVLDTRCRSLEDAAWTKRPMPGEWSFTEILCHLRDVDQEVNLPRLRKVMESDNPFIPGQDTDPWAEERRYRQQDGKQAYHQFLAARLNILHILESLEPEGWQKPVRHAIFGPTRLSELVNIITAHDRLHLQQVYRLFEQLSPDQIKD